MSIYAQRRQQLLDSLAPNSVVIIPGAREVLRNADTEYPFRQNSSFFYLTGFSEPQAIAVLQVDATKKLQYILFLRTRDPAKEIWTGRRLGLEGAQETLEVDLAYPITDFEQKLADICANKSVIYYPFAGYDWFTEILQKTLHILPAEKRLTDSEHFQDINPIIAEMRLYKSPEEIQHMQRAVDISMQAHVQAISVCKPGMFEYELAAEYLYQFAKAGAESPAYPCIVASGANACTLHYTENKSQLKAGELVLVDAGAEFGNYASDITRTFPVNGKFSAEQRTIYNIVLVAQKAVIDALKPGVSCRLSQEICTRVIVEGLREIGILHGSVEELLEKKAYLPFYMHSCSHWLGLDTHDAGAYKINDQWRALAENMVLTVEPGIYIHADSGVDPRWHNIGIRIEDDVLITQQGCRVLSEGLVKQIDDIESIMQ